MTYTGIEPGSPMQQAYTIKAAGCARFRKNIYKHTLCSPLKMYCDLSLKVGTESAKATGTDNEHYQYSSSVNLGSARVFCFLQRDSLRDCYLSRKMNALTSKSRLDAPVATGFKPIFPFYFS